MKRRVRPMNDLEQREALVQNKADIFRESVIP